VPVNLPLVADLPRWSVVLAYYNETDFIAATLASWAAQTVAFRLILVDNASSDDSAAICSAFRDAHPGLEVELMAESRPGHLFALETGAAAASGDFIAFSDADTLYPPNYLAQAEALLARPGKIAALAADLYAPFDSPASRLRRLKFAIVSRLLARQSHTGSYGYCFALAAYQACGGFSVERWPLMLYDHELIQRIGHQGRLAYDDALWCRASDRRGDSSGVRWTLFERILYHVTPFELKDWLFYDFLAPRFRARDMGFLNLRQRDW
jgi:glycosyltransferase involved in cell wall biosynthesis